MLAPTSALSLDYKTRLLLILLSHLHHQQELNSQTQTNDKGNKMSNPNNNPNLPPHSPYAHQYLNSQTRPSDLIYAGLRNPNAVAATNPNVNPNPNANPMAGRRPFLPPIGYPPVNMNPASNLANNPSPAASPVPSSPAAASDANEGSSPNQLEPPLELHISAPTTIRGSNNRVQLPGPRTQSDHFAKIMKLSINTAQPFLTGDPDFDDEENEKMGRGPGGVKVVVECGISIEGDGNVVAFKGLNGEHEMEVKTGGEGKGKGKRARSEPLEETEGPTNKLIKREPGIDQGS